MKGLILTYLMTYGGALASLQKPFIGLLIYICFGIIRPESLWFWAVPPGNYSRIVALALLAGWAMNGFGNWRFGRATPIVFLLFGFWFWMMLSACFAAYPAIAWDDAEKLSKILLPVLVGMTLIENTQQLKQIAWVIVISHGYLAYDFNLSYYGGFNRVYEAGFGGMDNNCVAIDMVTCTGMAFFLGFNAQRWWRKAAAFGSAGLMVHVVLFSFSRGGMLALIIVAVISFLLIPKRPVYFLVLIAGVLIAYRLAGEEVMKRFATVFVDEKERDASAQSRLDLWKNCWDVMQKHPLVGIGPKNFPQIAPEYGWPKGKEAHSLWVQLGAEMGFPGLFLLLNFYGVCILLHLRSAFSRKPTGDPWFQDSARMVIAAVCGFGVAAMFVTLTGLESPYYIVLLGAGVLKIHRPKPMPAPTPLLAAWQLRSHPRFSAPGRA